MGKIICISTALSSRGADNLIHYNVLRIKLRNPALYEPL